MSAHRLDWASSATSLDLVNADGGNGDEPWWFQTLSDGWSLGSPEAVKIIESSLMKDGSDSRIDHFENRSITFRVVVWGTNLAAVGRGERALVLQAAARSKLSWTPPDDFGETTGFIVVNATLDPVPDDTAEAQPGTKRRAFDLTFECLPFGLSATKVYESFPPGASSPALTSIDAFTAPNSGWSASATASSVSLGSATVDSDDYLQMSTGITGAVGSTATLARGATVTTLAYTAVTFGNTVGPTLVLDGVAYAPIGSDNVSTVNATKIRYWYATGAGSGRALSFRLSTGGGDNGRQYRFYDVSTSADVPEGVARTVRIRGSMRAAGDLSVAASGSTLGTTLVITGPLIGRYNPLIASGTFGAATNYFSAPAGAYAVVVFFNAAAPVGTTLTAGGVSKKIRTTDKIQTIGVIHLGALRGGGTQSGRLTLTNFSGIDGTMFLVPLDDDHSVTVGDYATKYLWLQSPDLEEPLGGVFAGAAADGSDAAPAWSSTRRHRTHLLAPPSTGVYVWPATATIGVEYFPAHHTYASSEPEDD